MKRLSELSRLDGRVAIVTGGAGHLGGAFAETLAELGARVVAVDVAADAVRARADEIAAHGGHEALAVVADLAEPAAAAAIVKQTLDRFGRLDVLVNNAAFTGAADLPGWAVPFGDQKLPAWDAALRVNLTAPFLLAQAAREALSVSGHGAVINVGSIYGVLGPDFGLYEGTAMGNPAAYAASKGGLVQLTRYLATALAPRVRVNCLAPGGIERGQPDVFRGRYTARTPLGRMATEEDMKGALAFLASDASAYVTGQTLLVDGGFSAW